MNDALKKKCKQVIAISFEIIYQNLIGGILVVGWKPPCQF
jgi:hypothetical protein